MSDSDKSQLTETEIRTRYITPAMSTAGWPLTSLREEYYYFSAGRIQVVGKKGVRKKPKKVDYLLEWRPNLPIAVVEAKDNNHEPGDGMQQAIEYAEQLDVPSVFTSNGDSFVWHDRTGSRPDVEVEIPLEQFPSPEALYQLYKQWKGIEDADEPVIAGQFHDDGSGRRPRYYQRIAVNRTLEAIAKDQKRLLLVMATGTGKTYTAAQIIWRFMESFRSINPNKGQARVLFLADRNILIDQTMMNDFAMFKGRMAKLSASRGTITKVANADDPDGGDSKVVDKSFELYLSLYQAVTGTEEIDNVYKQFSPDFFDLIIVDECHRGSAREDSAWRGILEYFGSAIQLGMTATPKETKTVSNIDYFGDPLYTYSLKQGIDDGFLAPYKVIRTALDVDTFGWRPEEGQRDDAGNLIPDRHYTGEDIDDSIVFPERDKRVAERITEYLKSTDRYAKVIVFCQDIPHANRMRRILANLNADEVRKDSRYVMQITGDDQQGKQELDNFIDPAMSYPVIATTSKLLATGVDAQTCKLIVLNSRVESMTDFKQMIGRGTRVRTDYDKWFFVIMDFKNVTKLFADEGFDGDPVKVYELPPDGDMNDAVEELDDVDETAGEREGDEGPEQWVERPGARNVRRKRIMVSGQAVTIIGEQVQMLGTDGKPLTSSLKEFVRSGLLERYPTADAFVSAWSAAEQRSALLDELVDAGIPLEDLVEQSGLALDPFDMALDVAYERQPIERRQRAAAVHANGYLGKYQGQMRSVLEALLEKYVESGLRSLEDIGVLRVEPFRSMGGPMELIRSFGTRETYFKAVHDLEQQLYQEAQ
ncbi:DEAD/DEAH box helicase family protein [Streptomyces sp. G44]|uniref:EcoAI/FtnUII family type I restriction enzme subunit R n=1 Tax=Streptomyces sp. G44 TaxID=2807632 RepID=UPI0019620B20|nr:DEAD/DEAH box helicase family protein [Streptomyces sp. G44]MBM7168601.1 DEAD/DEAH box helicase family protein [Streptomyces sp. G44]